MNHKPRASPKQERSRNERPLLQGCVKDDIVISTAAKSGTTLTQEIVRQLIFVGQEAAAEKEAALWEISPWLDARWSPLDELLTGLKAQQHRRFIKSHLALDGLPYFLQVKYRVVSRDVCDIVFTQSAVS